MDQNFLLAFHFLCLGAVFSVLFLVMENIFIFSNPMRAYVLQWKNFRQAPRAHEIFLKPARHVLFSRRVFFAVQIGFLLIQVLALALIKSGSGFALAVIFGLNLAYHLWYRVRFLGPFCGGSDAMMFQLALVVFLATVLQNMGEKYFLQLGRVLLIYLGVQVGLSYFLAGIKRVTNIEWWNGAALSRLLMSSAYRMSPLAKRTSGQLKLCALLSIAVILFELSSPAVLFMPMLLQVYIVLALVFHFFNSWLLGLNRFVWAWGFALPAFWYLGKFLQH